MAAARGRRWVRILVLALVVIAAGIVVARLAGLFAGRSPDNLGVRTGALAPCPPTPNCVSSAATYAQHAIAPLAYAGDPQEAITRLGKVLRAQARVRIVAEEPGYIRAEFTSAAFGFVDDVEFLLDRNAGVIQVRSASRLGRSDFDANRTRIEGLRAAFAAAR